MNKRILKCLRRIEAGKSVPDFGALCAAEERGFVTMSGPSDDIDLTITDAGKAFIAAAQQEPRNADH